jgi:hypothetical protein
MCGNTKEMPLLRRRCHSYARDATLTSSAVFFMSEYSANLSIDPTTDALRTTDGEYMAIEAAKGALMPTLTFLKCVHGGWPLR